MAHYEITASAPPDAVFAVLSDPCAYPEFVVGTKEVRRYDDHWPHPGAAIHWSAGVWRLLLKDETVVLENEPSRVLHERIRMGPYMITDVRFELRPEGDGTRIRIDEYVVDGPLKVISPAIDLLLWLRNHELLRRLAKLAESAAAARRESRSPLLTS